MRHVFSSHDKQIAAAADASEKSEGGGAGLMEEEKWPRMAVDARCLWHLTRTKLLPMETGRKQNHLEHHLYPHRHEKDAIQRTCQAD
jgi:hypothetical protein